MHREFIRTILGVSFSAMLASLVGCGTPTFVTKAYDDSYKEQITALKVLLVRVSFPRVDALLREKGIGTPGWYDDVAARMEQNFRHNGVLLSAKIVGNAGSVAVASSARSGDVPTLVLYPVEVIIMNGDFVRAFTIRASLLVPQREKPVWEAITVSGAREAADDVSLKVLNELSNLKLVVLTRTPPRRWMERRAIRSVAS